MFQFVPLQTSSILSALKATEKPLQTMEKIHILIKELTQDIKQRLLDPKQEGSMILL